jgi:DNA-directed RNA polymerase subunit RPC12/RpoP
MKNCNECGEKFENNKIYANHVRWKHKKIEYKRIQCPYCDYNVRNENYNKHIEVCPKSNHNIFNCLNCGEIGKNHGIKFCSRSCSAIYNNQKRKYNKIDRSYITPEWRDAQRQRALKNWRNGLFNMERKIFFNSKNERAIVKYIKENYPNDEWKSGGVLNFSDGNIIARDLWSDKLKICFEYDGVWHFKDIHGQLEKKQIKDRLLEEWCKANNYRLVRIDENMYKGFDQIVDLLYNRKEKIIKIGDRYTF